jgi:hypothetical protein
VRKFASQRKPVKVLSVTDKGCWPPGQVAGNPAQNSADAAFLMTEKKFRKIQGYLI